MILEDFGTYWDQGIIDPALEGSWQNSNGKCLQYIKSNDDYTIKDEALTIRTLALKNSTYMMMKESESHFLYKYTVNDNELTLYSPNQGKKTKYLKQYPNQKIVLGEYTVTIKTLDISVINLLEKIGNQPEFWTEERVLIKQSENCPQ